jgi:hypothetical protein
MCLACDEAELWAAYQAEMARRAGAVLPQQTGPMTANNDDAKVQAGPDSGRGPAASKCECK